MHFRCSDTPFCRNPLSRLLYDRFYHAAAAVIHERRRSPVRSILLVHTAATIVGPWAWRRNHRPLQGRPCNAGLCAAHVRALLLRIFPLWRGSPAAVLLAACRPCSHAGRSLLLYIGSASSFSTFVAVLRTGPSVLPANNPWLVDVNASYTHSGSSSGTLRRANFRTSSWRTTLTPSASSSSWAMGQRPLPAHRHRLRHSFSRRPRLGRGGRIFVGPSVQMLAENNLESSVRILVLTSQSSTLL